MARSYSNDLRERVVAAVAAGRSCRTVTGLFGVSVASVVKWSQRHRATGTAAARPMGGHRWRLLEPHRTFLLERLATVPDLTMPALVASWRNAASWSTRSRWRMVRSAGLKATLFATEQLQPQVARRRAQWRKYQGRVDPRRLVFINETCLS